MTPIAIVVIVTAIYLSFLGTKKNKKNQKIKNTSPFSRCHQPPARREGSSLCLSVSLSLFTTSPTCV